MAIARICTLASGIILLTLAGAPPAYAQADEDVKTLGFKRGERELEFKFGNLRKRGQPREREAAVGIGYAPNRNWFTQLGAEFESRNGSGLRADAFEWENKFQFAEPGRYPLDFGLLAELNRYRDRSEGYALRFGPLMQKEVGRVTLNANVLLERTFDAAIGRPTELGYQWQARYNWRPQLDVGLQGFGELGPWDNWAPRSQQSHRFGPAIFGKFKVGGDEEIEYNAALLTDPSNRARSYGLRLKAQYKF